MIEGQLSLVDTNEESRKAARNRYVLNQVRRYFNKTISIQMCGGNVKCLKNLEVLSVWPGILSCEKESGVPWAAVAAIWSVSSGFLKELKNQKII
jgi:hypothetical protein